MRGLALLHGRRRRLSVGEDNFLADEIARQRLFRGLPPGGVQGARPAGEREFPYGRRPACGPDTSAFRHVGPAWRPNPPAPTAPMAVVAVAADTAVIAPVCAQAASTDPEDVARALGALRDVDFSAVDEAKKTEGATHVSVRAARGPVPLHDQVLLAGRPPRERPPVAAAAVRHLGALAYPPCDVTAPDHALAYVALMRRLDAITGTQGRNRWALHAIPAGGAA